MSKPLEKIDEFDYFKDSDKFLEKLNAAIDRINELEAKYERHTHDTNMGYHSDIDDDVVWQSGPPLSEPTHEP